MKYNKEKLEDIIERLQSIIEYDYITYPTEDEKKVEEILLKIDKLVEDWEDMQDSNYSY